MSQTTIAELLESVFPKYLTGLEIAIHLDISIGAVNNAVRRLNKRRTFQYKMVLDDNPKVGFVRYFRMRG